MPGKPAPAASCVAVGREGYPVQLTAPGTECFVIAQRALHRFVVEQHPQAGLRLPQHRRNFANLLIYREWITPDILRKKVHIGLFKRTALGLNFL